MTRVTWRGVTVDDRTAAMLDAADRLLPTIRFNPSQGSYSGSVAASGGTHDGGGAVDIRLGYTGQGGQSDDLSDADAKTIETVMRSVGFAAWYRPTLPGVWQRHVHGIAVDCPDLSLAAVGQVVQYRNGRNGLANNGPDTGTRAYVGVTWETHSQAGSSIPPIFTNPPASTGSSTGSTTPNRPTALTEEPMRIVNVTDGTKVIGQALATADGMTGFASQEELEIAQRYVAVASGQTAAEDNVLNTRQAQVVNGIFARIRAGK